MDIFSALSDPTRRKIIESLVSGERSVGEIAGQFKMSGPAVSQHLKVLREARLVSVRVDAQRRIYRLDGNGFSEVEEWLTRVRQTWNRRLDRLEHVLREGEKTHE